MAHVSISINQRYGLKGFINGDNKCPKLFLSLKSTNKAVTSTENQSRYKNLKCTTWMKINQLLLSWMMSLI